ncbi:hypothetical protein OHA70_03585 [Kribbella sp. NBC_00382]|uniref:hypothetical protein n=1 Tax=Kribbella sp. NBC_00382 TaxID=2975967 RepID=UPI002E1D3836
MPRPLLRRLFPPQYELSEDELTLRYWFVVRHRIPRSEVAFAKFEYDFPGIARLHVHRRDGSVVKVRMEPRWTSTELSGDPAQPGSAAYEITEWARKSTT